MTSKIEWTDETWNPVVGCSKVSAGCRHCYAETMACRLAYMGNRAYQDVTTGHDSANWFQKWNGKTAFVESQLEKPLRWKKPRRVFVCSMGDLFHESVPFEWIDRILSIIWASYQHTFMVLTKRPERMKEYFTDNNPRYSCRKVADCLPAGSFGTFDCDMNWPLPNLWLGTTCENQDAADQRIPILLEIPAAVRFISVEPMLGPVDLSGQVNPKTPDGRYMWPCSESMAFGLDWVICGGESGPDARAMHPLWVRSLRDQCAAVRAPFFFKQWGEWCFLDQMPDDTFSRIDASDNNPTSPMDYQKPWKVGKKAAGRLLDGKEWTEYPADPDTNQEGV